MTKNIRKTASMMMKLTKLLIESDKNELVKNKINVKAKTSDIKSVALKNASFKVEVTTGDVEIEEANVLDVTTMPESFSAEKNEVFSLNSKGILKLIVPTSTVCESILLVDEKVMATIAIIKTIAINMIGLRFLLKKLSFLELILSPQFLQ